MPERDRSDLSHTILEVAHGDLEKQSSSVTDNNSAVPQVAITDWDGPRDPENPQNWPLWKRVWMTSVPGLMGLAVTLGSSIYTPGIREIESEMNISNTVALLGLSMWVLGLAFGPILAAPLSESRGRNSVYYVSLPVSMLFTMGAGLSQSPEALIICRFFGGFFGSPALAVGAGTAADLWAPKQRAVATVLFIYSPFAGPSLGPVIGGFAAQNRGWRWTQWATLIFSGGVFIYCLPTQETHKKIILQRRAKRLGVPGPTDGQKLPLKALLWTTVVRPLHMLVTEKIVTSFCLYVAFNFSVLFGMFDSFPIVFNGVYGFDRGIGGLMWLSVLVGCTLGVITFVIVDKAMYQPKLEQARAGGKEQIAPEHRLYSAMIGSFGLPLGLFWFGWTARADVSWASPCLAAVPFAWGNIMVFASCAVYLVDTYGPMAGASASAANGFARYGMGAIFPLFTNQMYVRLGVGWATSIYGFIAILLLPIPWVLFIHGPSLRSKSRYMVSQD